MSQFLLSVHSDNCEDPTPSEPPSPEDMQASMEKVMALEADMKASGTFLFSGALTDPGSATVVRSGGDELAMTDGPYAEAKEHIAGFYAIEAADLDEALAWAGRVVECINAPIEVRPFQHFAGQG